MKIKETAKETINEKISALPASPGVYIMKGKTEILYIGKAKNLRSRVRSYFGKSGSAGQPAGRAGDGRYSVRYLVKKVEDIDTIVTTSEKEALILEDTLLKKHRPRYNIRLKDDKTYVSIKLTVNERFPRIAVTRRVRDDGGRYFGPHASARMARDTVKFLRRIFPLCVCTAHEFRNRARPCLDYQLGLCSAPASGLVSEEAYKELVDGAVMFLEGRNRELTDRLKRKMREAACARMYEEAARLRDRIRSIEATLEGQSVLCASGMDRDAFGVAEARDDLAITVLFIREGRLVGTRDFTFRGGGAVPVEENLGSFLSQFYRGHRFVPEEVLIPVSIDGREAMADWLSGKKGKKVCVRKPARGEGRKLVQLAGANAQEAVKRLKAAEETSAVEELKKRLRLSSPPERIEAFDMSNTGGKYPVGAMVAFTRGVPDRARYRLYRIQTVTGPDDYAMMKEVLSRRYESADEADIPDLVVVDGGKGQLSIALDVMRGLKPTSRPRRPDAAVVALAKEKVFRETGKGREHRGERVYLKGVKEPVFLKEGSKGDLLLRRIRDEAHRFAVGYHRKLRGKGMASMLEDIPGIGRKRRIKLFERFGDLDGIKRASVEELTDVPGVTAGLAAAIKGSLSDNKRP
ncbi:MAG: excinuclease ABC subunit UvrC [Deltaproteobacteria bacterium]|nr:excinuclease ABC subunit UvrC [Deltaproteobacteria bacterium]